MYRMYIKRILDIVVAMSALVVLAPVFLFLVVCNMICMKGNPFFIQLRPGKDEKIFKLIKFRTMSCEKDENGHLLPDEKRLNRYGRFLRSSSLDELPELLNIVKGDMSIVGPRPLVPQYLRYYNDLEKHRHDVRPGLTGLAQINGRNSISWEKRFYYDIQYVNNIKFTNDIKIIMKTIWKVIKKSDISVRGTTELMDFDKYRSMQLNEK